MREGKPAWYEAPRVGAITPEDFVALALAEPIASPTAEYGYALRAASGNPRPPGVIALTWIAAKDANRDGDPPGHSRQNVQDFVAEPGFISIVTGFTGLARLHGDRVGRRSRDEAGAQQAPCSGDARAIWRALRPSVWTVSGRRRASIASGCADLSCGALEDLRRSPHLWPCVGRRCRRVRFW